MGNGKPLIAILMAVYEPRMDWLREQLESLNAQTYPNLRLYIRDDCSPAVPFEEIRALVETCITKFPFTIARNAENVGSNKTFERLTEEAEGDLFAYCDQDDVWLPEKLEILQEEMERTGALLVCSGVWAGSEIAPLTGEREGTYVPGLDGYLTNGAALNATAELLEGEEYFSTYASALETIHGVYQPSGTDYIIHVLGEEQREDYLNCFREGEFPYAVTIERYYNGSIWEWWVQRANWWFYRELYANYVPIESPSDYAEIWRRQEGGAAIQSDDIDFAVERLSDTQVRLSIQKGPELDGHELVADVELTYRTADTGSSLRHGVMVEDLSLWDYENTVYYLPEGEHTVHIPMIVKDGVWSVTLNACPSDTTALELVEAEVVGLFDQGLMDYAFFG